MKKELKKILIIVLGVVISVSVFYFFNSPIQHYSCSPDEIRFEYDDPDFEHGVSVIKDELDKTIPDKSFLDSLHFSISKDPVTQKTYYAITTLGNYPNELMLLQGFLEKIPKVTNLSYLSYVC